MKRIVVNMLTAVIMAAILCACGGCKSKSGGIPQITMTVMPNVYGNVFSASIGLAGSGTASINWGDGSKSQTVTLLDDALAYTHDYSADKASDIVITGENITGFFCGDIYEYYLETLDVSKNPALEELSCSNSPLNVLDVSKNTALKKLVCYNNGLETLDLSRNIALEYLDCSYNNLTALDVSRNTALTELDCSYNNLTRLDLSANPNLIELISMENPFEQSDDSLTWQCGENLIYTLSGGVLTISGTGAMYDYMPAGGPDQEFEGFRYYPIQTVVLPDGITTIGDYAFGGCEGLTTVVIPSSVTSIGNWAFTGCESLTSVAIPNSVTLIGSEAFAGCSSLKNIAIPNSVTDISMFAFYNSGLTSVVIPNSVTSIGAAAFAYCGDLT
ncbi:MAG: leucine-rich repeat protein, partial [Treponema sp.]|nr:leucine-rich repeat protein [Treponema sp.]